jgi:hypothetical protein
MAELRIVEGELVLHLTGLEHAEGFHGDLRAAVGQVRAVRAVPDVWTELRGMRAPGTGLPGVIAVGTRRFSGGKDFAAVHGQGPGVVVELEGHEFERFVLSADDAEALARDLHAQLGRATPTQVAGTDTSTTGGPP